MKKILAIIGAIAAIGGAAYVLYRKFGKRSMVVSGEFDDDETIIMDEGVEEESEETSAE